MARCAIAVCGNSGYQWRGVEAPQSEMTDPTDHTPSPSREHLLESEARFRTIFEQAPFSLQILSPEGRTLKVNRAWKDLWRIPDTIIESFILKTYNVLEDPQLEEKGVTPYLRRAFAGEPVELPVIQYVPPEMEVTGRPRWVEAFAYPVKDASGRLREVVLIHDDVTKKVESEQALRQSEAQLRLITDNLPVLISYIDTDLTYRFVNAAYESWFGRPRAEVVNRSVRSVVGDEVFTKVAPRLRQALDGEPVRFEMPFPHPTLGSRHLDITYIPHVVEGGPPAGFFILATDITERKRTETRKAFLAEASSILASSIDHKTTLSNVAQTAVPAMGDWCIVDLVDPASGEQEELAIFHTNPEKIEIFRKLRRLMPPTSDQGISKVLRSGEPELIPEVTEEILRRRVPPGELLEMLRGIGFRSVMIAPLKVHNEIIGAISFARTASAEPYGQDDLDTAMALAQRASVAIENAKLYQDAQEAIQARDEFMSICSHELKTPVTSLLLQFQIAKRRVAQGDDQVYSVDQVNRRLDAAEKQLLRLTRLIEDMLDSSRAAMSRLDLRREPVDLGLLVEEVASRFSEQLSLESYRLEWKLDRDVVAMVDRYRIDQVITNLITNAIKYGEGRPIRISTHREDSAAVILVEDRGMGIAPEHLDRIFHRFERATSFRKISGLGLGLYISRQIVEAHGGKISVSSRPGEGSTFRVELPL